MAKNILVREEISITGYRVEDNQIPRSKSGNFLYLARKEGAKEEAIVLRQSLLISGRAPHSPRP